ncbi:MULTISPECIES: cytochrome c [Rhizobium]|uniref:Cytochrome C n=1 Tax=Rhizobium tropici TaxID=398 RepID=A0A329YH95_RHITR|nr:MULTISPECIES: cytochrome c [Rhizobium]MBB3289570.1 mono/diheme cytochrome c family protein [Rhizobium sp. BK252]MBB3404513.1 mono/diheme cytochrome c family protein [Rhizobium sp. BK289]MBB3416899.1 mono/diheme cytochrome c family protein [Rhizobium sp. BK284]MBB3484776.1 mono/diheme cytochrome c family protein [Rhizobium sp. BK347]RAX39770.1 cytochrome C [Rhizobium tropici]
MQLTKRHLWAGIGGLGVLGAVGLAIAAWIVYEPEIPKIARPDRKSFSPEIIKKGEQLATAGDCIVCHTADNGPAFAGSRPLATPFGVLYSNNITPDEETGIGNWSPEAFRRAVKHGVGRDGSHLYPALPYEHFIKVSDDDLDAIYAFLMTREAISKAAPPNELLPGLGIRQLLAGWKLLFLHGSVEPEDTSQTAEWNRGKYLVDGLAHCGACHTPRNLLGGEEWGREFQGGIAEGWNAPPLDPSNPSADRWTVDTLIGYLTTGTNSAHSTAAGPMGPVTEGLSRLNSSDVRAIAVYIDSMMHPSGDEPRNSAAGHEAQPAATAAVTNSEAATLFQGACAGCHEPASPMAVRGRPLLSATSDLNSEDPRNAIQAVLQGIEAPVASNAPYMPSFADNLTDGQIADLLGYARSRFTSKEPWPGLERTVRDIRKENQK